MQQDRDKEPTADADDPIRAALDDLGKVAFTTDGVPTFELRLTRDGTIQVMPLAEYPNKHLRVFVQNDVLVLLVSDETLRHLPPRDRHVWGAHLPGETVRKLMMQLGPSLDGAMGDAFRLHCRLESRETLWCERILAFAPVTGVPPEVVRPRGSAKSRTKGYGVEEAEVLSRIQVVFGDEFVEGRGGTMGFILRADGGRLVAPRLVYSRPGHRAVSVAVDAFEAFGDPRVNLPGLVATIVEHSWGADPDPDAAHDARRAGFMIAGLIYNYPEHLVRGRAIARPDVRVIDPVPSR